MAQWTGDDVPSWLDGDSSSQPWYAVYSLYGRSSATTDRSLDYCAWARYVDVPRNRHQPAAAPQATHSDRPDRTGL